MTVTEEYQSENRPFEADVAKLLQLMVQKRVIRRALTGSGRPKPPFVLKLLDRFPLLRRIPGRLLAVGVRPEHIHTPDVKSAP